MAYIGTSPSNGVRRRFVYVATSNQTSFSGNDENGVSLVYVDVAYLDVYQNGVKLKSVDDYASTTGTSVVLVQGASTDDIIEIIAYDVFSVADTVSAKDGGNFAGNVGMGGTLAVTGVPTFTGRSVHSGGITIANAGQIGSVGDADAMAISSGGVVTFSQIPSGTPTSTVFKLVNTGNQDLSNGVETVLQFNSAPIDTASITSTGSNNVTITAATAGTYLIQGNSRISQRPGRQQLLFLIGTTITLIAEQSENDAGSGANPTIGFSSIIALSDGDVLTMKHWQASGGTITTIAGYSQPSLMGVRLF